MLSVKGGQRWTETPPSEMIGSVKQHNQQYKNFQNCVFPLYVYLYSLYISVRVGVGVDFLEVAVQAKLCCSSDFTEFYSRALLGRFPPSSASRAYYSTGRLAPCKLDLLLKLTPAPPARVNDADEL